MLGLHFAKIIRVTGFRQRRELPARYGARTELTQRLQIKAVIGGDRDGRVELVIGIDGGFTRIDGAGHFPVRRRDCRFLLGRTAIGGDCRRLPFRCKPKLQHFQRFRDGADLGLRQFHAGPFTGIADENPFTLDRNDIAGRAQIRNRLANHCPTHAIAALQLRFRGKLITVFQFSTANFCAEIIDDLLCPPLPRPHPVAHHATLPSCRIRIPSLLI
ncbi:hypothetical protein D3C86_1405020 [compost metagenome]